MKLLRLLSLVLVLAGMLLTATPAFAVTEYEKPACRWWHPYGGDLRLTWR